MQKDMEDSLEQLKSRWANLKVRDRELEEANKRLAERLRDKRVMSLQQRLYRRHIKMAYLAWIMPVLAPFLYFIVKCPLWLAALYGVAGIVMFFSTRNLAIHIKRTQMADLPVAQALQAAMKIRLLQYRKMLGGIAMALVVLIPLFYYLFNEFEDKSVVEAGFIGLVLGLAVSVPRTVINIRIAARIIRQFKDNLAEDEPEA